MKAESLAAAKRAALPVREPGRHPLTITASAAPALGL
jgi:hypothetical protein